jgi:D-beta-D-heptose 7-phosphate kinase/D-beta-D-heptose 1-phosphate adenosyltransferase
MFDEDTPYELIKKIKPDVLVKGADYKGKSIAGSDIVESSGGETVLINFIEGKSTSEIIKKIKSKSDI